MLVFRFHRGSLDESLSTAKEFKSQEELFEFLKEWINQELPGYAKQPIQLIREFYAYDDRLNSNDDIITFIDNEGQENVLGMCSVNITLDEIKQNYYKWLKEYRR